MTKIQELPADVVSSIAAGQVIERPVSVIKELVDNALDAGATRIVIEIEKGGIHRITVRDNGRGMTKADLAVCYLRHTTSKISQLKDIEHLQTLGFRGEGLASMVAVANVSISSRLKTEEIGFQVSIKNGKAQPIEPVGMPAGSSISVEAIFKHLPARKKFLKREQTEYRYIVQLVTAYAYTYPQIEFILIHNGKRILHLSAQTLEKRISSVSKIAKKDLIALKGEGEYVGIEGYIGKPEIASRNSPLQYLFINHRFVQYPEIEKAIKQSYRTLLEPYAQPVFFLNISVPTHMLDINIDPKKEKVHLFHLKQVIATLTDLIATELDKIHSRYSLESTHLHVADSGMEFYTAKTLKRNTVPWSLKDIEAEQEIAQFHDTYLIAQTDDGIIMIDQHAAHERILYEQFLASFMQQKAAVEQVTLSKPQKITFSVVEFAMIEECFQLLQAHGFKIEVKNSEVWVYALPTLFRGRDSKQLLLELCEDFIQMVPEDKIDLISHKTIAYLACRSAIKAGEVLTKEERFRLLAKLSQTKTQYTCPHGRPVQLTISLQELEKMFHRR